MKVVFCAPFSHEYLKPDIQLRNHLLSNHASSWIRVIAEELVEQNNTDLHIITVSSNFVSDQFIRKNNISFHLIKSNFPETITRLVPFSLSSILWSKSIWKMVNKIKSIKPDVVHGHGTEHCYSLVATMSGFPTVISLQGVVNKIYKSYPTLRYKLISYVEKYTIKRAKHINVKTKMSETFLEESGYTGKKHFIEAAIEKSYWDNAVPQFGNNIFFVGQLVEEKGIYEFIEMFIQLRNVFNGLHAYVIGEGDNKRKKIMYKMLEDSFAGNDLTFTGQISYKEIIHLYQCGGIFCLSSYIENSPNAVMEAMAAGLPVVATDVGSVRDIVHDRKSGLLVEKKNTDDLVEKLSVIFNDRKLYTKFAKNGRTIANERWKPSIIAKKHINMYNELI
jgi:glycosyltransferase involved in cell wall biosynthesis